MKEVDGGCGGGGGVLNGGGIEASVCGMLGEPDEA